MGAKSNAYPILVGKPEDSRPLGRSRCRWEKYRKMYFKEIGCEVVEGIYVAQNWDWLRVLLNTLMNLRVFDYMREY